MDLALVEAPRSGDEEAFGSETTWRRSRAVVQLRAALEGLR
jgi:hypothetical protein